jgi:DNA transposition AAA+ family ATPase
MMSVGNSHVNGQIPIKNVSAFMALTLRLIERDRNLPGLGVCHGPSGFGKTYASIFARTKTRSIGVEVGDSWTRKTLLTNILKELGVTPKGSNGELADKAIEALGEDPYRALIIDEADKLIDKGMIELVRELLDQSGAPIVLIGEEQLPRKLLATERVHNRVLDWMPAQACDEEDAGMLARAFCAGLAIEPELLAAIVSVSQGRARRIVVNLSRCAEQARNAGKSSLGLADMRERLFTGAPPTARSIDAYRARAA